MQSLPKSSQLYRKLFVAKASALLYAGVYSEALDTANVLLEDHSLDKDGWNIKFEALEKLNRKKDKEIFLKEELLSNLLSIQNSTNMFLLLDIHIGFIQSLILQAMFRILKHI